MLNYFLHERTHEGIVYSCDKICIKGELNYSDIKSFGRSLSDFLLQHYMFDIRDTLSLPWQKKSLKDYKCFERYGIGEYRYNLNISLTDSSSFYFGYQHNSNSINNCSWKIELNPNKCLPCEFIVDFLTFVYSFSKVSSIEISQMDIAFDFELPRSCFYLEKDRRISTVINDGFNNTTEYLSKHNSHGFCKLYNKQIESNLDYQLTRFEITLKKYDYQSVCDVLPKLHIYDKKQITIDEVPSELSINDSVFVELLRLHPEYKKKLTSRKQQKFAPYLDYEAPLFIIDKSTYEKLYYKIKEFFIWMNTKDVK